MSNENDSFTEVSNTSWGSRIGGSFKGIIIGIALFIGGTVLLYWNEGRAVHSSDALDEAKQAVVKLTDINTVDSSFDGKLVHASGMAKTAETISDPIFGIKSNSIALQRKVEYYQWVEKSNTETKKKLGGGEERVTTYSYEKKWTAEPVDSQNFKKPAGHHNTARINAGNETWHAKEVTLGAYRLPESLIRAIGGKTAYNITLSESEQKELEKQIIQDSPEYNQTEYANTSRYSSYSNAYRSPYRSYGHSSPYAQKMLHIQGSTLYIGPNAHNPQVGDVRVTFTIVPQANVSILAKMQGDTFEPFVASNGNTVSKLSMGTVSSENMIQQAKEASSTTTWIFRILGIILLFAGVRAILAPIQVLADVIPILGSIVGAGLGLVATLFGVAWGLIVIAISWIRFRPMLAFALIAAAVILIGFVFLKGKKGKADVPPSPASQT